MLKSFAEISKYVNNDVDLQKNRVVVEVFNQLSQYNAKVVAPGTPIDTATLISNYRHGESISGTPNPYPGSENKNHYPRPPLAWTSDVSKGWNLYHIFNRSGHAAAVNDDSNSIWFGFVQRGVKIGLNSAEAKNHA